MADSLISFKPGRVLIGKTVSMDPDIFLIRTETVIPIGERWQGELRLSGFLSKVFLKTAEKP
jgi:hypothetical protein